MCKKILLIGPMLAFKEGKQGDTPSHMLKLNGVHITGFSYSVSRITLTLYFILESPP